MVERVVMQVGAEIRPVAESLPLLQSLCSTCSLMPTRCTHLTPCEDTQPAASYPTLISVTISSHMHRSWPTSHQYGPCAYETELRPSPNEPSAETWRPSFKINEHQIEHTKLCRMQPLLPTLLPVLLPGLVHPAVDGAWYCLDTWVLPRHLCALPPCTVP